MSNNKKSKITDLLYVLLIVAFVIVCGYFFYFYNAADTNYIVALENEEDYPVYSGRNVYEHWKTNLNDNEQIVYDELKEGFLQFKSEISTSVDKLSTVELENAYTAVFLDHPEIFWMKSYKAVEEFNKNINTAKKIQLVYYSTQEEAIEIKSRLEKNYQGIIDGALEQENDFKKIKYVHDELIKLGTYDNNDKYDTHAHEFQTMISIFDTGESVCAGYSFGFKFIMDNLGIDSIVTRDIANDDADDNHIWNMVKLYGKWYNLDITWDDSFSEGEIVYNYFLKDNEEFYASKHKMQKGIPTNEE